MAGLTKFLKIVLRLLVSPQGRLHQVEYALEAVKQGSAVVGLRSKTHAILVALKRAPSELASYQKKMLRIDNHIGMGFAGLTSDARVLSNYMRQLSLSSRVVYSRPIPLSRLISALSDRAQLNTMQYGKRPYGVGFLVIGVDGTGPHLYEFSPTGNCFEFYAMALGARSQSAKTYLERRHETFADMGLDELVQQGLYALRDTLQQGKDVSNSKTGVWAFARMTNEPCHFFIVGARRNLAVDRGTKCRCGLTSARGEECGEV